MARLLALSVLPAVAYAFSNTVPVAVWSSHSDLTSLEAADSASALVSNVLSGADICNHEAIVLIEHPGVHASDLRTLPSSSSLLASLKSAHTSRQFPYVSDDMIPLDVPASAQSVTERCGSRYVKVSPGMGGVTLEKGSKHVVCMNMPHIHADHPNGRKGAMQDHDSLLHSELNAIKATFPKHLIIFAGTSSPSSFSKRQGPDSARPTRPVISDVPEESQSMSVTETPGPRPNIVVLDSGNVYNYANTNSTVPKNAGILKKYQILTPGLIMSLIVAFGLLVPLLLVGISTLASIQSPLRVEAPKSFDAASKKNQ